MIGFLQLSNDDQKTVSELIDGSIAKLAEPDPRLQSYISKLKEISRSSMHDSRLYKSWTLEAQRKLMYYSRDVCDRMLDQHPNCPDELDAMALSMAEVASDLTLVISLLKEYERESKTLSLSQFMGMCFDLAIDEIPNDFPDEPDVQDAWQAIRRVMKHCGCLKKEVDDASLRSDEDSDPEKATEHDDPDDDDTSSEVSDLTKRMSETSV